MRALVRRLPLVLVLALVVAACGGGEEATGPAADDAATQRLNAAALPEEADTAADAADVTTAQDANAASGVEDAEGANTDSAGAADRSASADTTADEADTDTAADVSAEQVRALLETAASTPPGAHLVARMQPVMADEAALDPQLAGVLTVYVEAWDDGGSRTRADLLTSAEAAGSEGENATMITVVSGDTMWAYAPGVDLGGRQAYVERTFDRSQAGIDNVPRFLRVLASELSDGATLTPEGTETVAGRTAYRVAVAPREDGASAELSALSAPPNGTLWVDAETGLPLKVALDVAPTADGGQTTLPFAGLEGIAGVEVEVLSVEYTERFDDALFAPPEGATSSSGTGPAGAAATGGGAGLIGAGEAAGDLLEDTADTLDGLTGP